MYYNRILSARLKGLKKEILLKNRQQTQKKSLHTIELWQASIFLFYPFSFKKCGISNSNESNVIFCELGHYLLS